MSLFILDWDDTLFCTSEILPIQDYPLMFNTNLKIKLKLLSNSILTLFNEIQKYGAFIIVTNADSGWIETSSFSYMPDVYNFIKLHNIYIIPTNSENKFIIDSKQKTFQNFINLILENYSYKIDIINIGDSLIERHALLNLNNDKIRFKKNIKFIDRPSIDNLIKEIDITRTKIKEIFDYNENIDLQINFNN